MKSKVIFLLALLGLSSPLMAEDAPEAAPEASAIKMLMMIAIGLLFFYFILWRPEQKRRKALATQRNSMKKGDKVTAMGIIGTVVRIEADTVILKMYDGAKIEVLKAAISHVESQPQSAEGCAKEEKECCNKKVELVPEKD